MTLKTLLPLLLLFGFTATAQVTLQTGAPSINIPLIQYTDEASKLKLDISLSYTGGNGIKVDEKASEVGLGWTLNAGGMVQRIKIGEPDDQIHIEISRMNSSNKPDPIHIPAGIFNQPSVANVPSDVNYQKLAWNPSYDMNDGTKTYYDPLVHYDREHDKFIYSMNGTSGSFILGKTYPHEALEEEISGNKISVINEIPSGSNAGSIKGFSILNEEGIKYTYENKLTSKIMNYKKVFSTEYRLVGSYYWLPTYQPGLTTRNQYTTTGYPYNFNNQFGVFVPFATAYEIANAWYISKIENTLTDEKIIFNYYTNSFVSNEGIFGAGSTAHVSTSGNASNGSTLVNSIEINENYKEETYPILYSIDLPKGKKVEFQYLNPRKDEVGKTTLDEIRFYNSNQLQSKYILKYGYFYESSILDEVNLPNPVMKNDVALALKSITKYGADGYTEPSTNFEYYTGVSGSSTLKFPKRNAFSNDHWGYYNAKNINQVSIRVNNSTDVISFSDFKNYIENRNVSRAPSADVNVVQIGMLKSITNKYSGKTVFSYSTNKHSYVNSTFDILSGGVKVEEIRNYSNETEFTAKKYEYKKPNGLSSSDFFAEQEYEIMTETYIIKPGGSFWACDKYNRYTGSSNNIVTTGETALSIAKGALGTIKNGANLAKLLGVKVPSAFFTNINYIVAIVQFLKLTGIFQNTSTEDYSVNFANLTSPVNSNNIPGSNYSMVKEINYGSKNNSLIYNGYSNYEFVSVLDKPIDIYSPNNIYRFPYSNRQRKLTFLYNMPKSVRLYDESNNLLSEKIFSYGDLINQNNSFNYSSKKYGAGVVLVSPNDPNGNTRCGSQTAYNYIGPHVTPSKLILDNYGFFSGKSYLTQTTEKQYNGTNFIETKTDYTYVPNSHLQRSVKTTDSKGDITESKVFYSSDFNTAVETDLASKNIITPIATELWKTKNDVLAKPKLLSTSITEYGTTPNGDLKPIKSYSLKADAPVPVDIIGEFNPNLPIRDANLITLNGEILYDAKGNEIQEITAPNNTVNSVMYNNENIPIATVTNSNRADIAYTSFETNGELNGGFTAVKDDSPPTDDNYIPFYATGLCPTGNRYVELSRPLDQIYSTINISKESILSFWTTTDNFRVNFVYSIRNIITGPTINGWTYHQLTIPAGTPQITITGQTKIDEVRLYPTNAKMITTTYDLANNKTDECDINNRITYFESDKLGRPTKVMDEKRNIIKTFEYNFKN